ncbi:hypothetical protein HHI36_010953 [Cryptolaemus montrouzieri]|uniref:Uncharacterized protein n=1 Tax=Cryptolaemus montrouzieri TaxID=559131 RepID=A0ABD2MK78_9CUCU
MASDKMKCVFCKGHKDKIILFVEDKLKKCQEVLSIRVKYKLKYNNIQLPTELNDTDGYHRQCYSSFTALMAKYRNSSLEIDYTSDSTPHSLSSSTLVDNSESTVKNLKGATSSLDYRTTLGDVDSSSTCDLSINETNICDDIPDTNTDGIETGRQLKNVCFIVIRIVSKIKSELNQDDGNAENSSPTRPPQKENDL